MRSLRTFAITDHDHVFDLAVFRREDTCATVGEEAADGRAGDGGGQMHGGKAFLVAAPFEMLGDDARLAGDGQRLLVDLDQLVHPFHIDDDAAVDRQGAAL